jgi:hypothetical protein
MIILLQQTMSYKWNSCSTILKSLQYEQMHSSTIMYFTPN